MLKGTLTFERSSIMFIDIFVQTTEFFDKKQQKMEI